MISREGKRFAIRLEDQHEVQERWYPATRFREADTIVRVAGLESGKAYQFKYGDPAEDNHAASGVSAEGLDGVVMLGGYTPERITTIR